jgi:hypothetical protein
MTRLIAAVAIALLATASADAGPRQKSQQPEARAWQSAAVAARAWAPGPVRPVGPSWAGPNECFTDDGYGRFWPCSAGPCGR